MLRFYSSVGQWCENSNFAVEDIQSVMGNSKSESFIFK